MGCCWLFKYIGRWYDPDIELDQFQHLLQTSESIWADGHEDWFVLTGFIYDLRKVLCLFGEPQWAVVGDTCPVGCEFSNKIVCPEFLDFNPDTKNPIYNTPLGIYYQNCGLDKVKMSWGHDEYLYQVLKQNKKLHKISEKYWDIIRYHSFYPWHTHNEYTYFMNDKDYLILDNIKDFNQYDLYSKEDDIYITDDIINYYKDLLKKYFPDPLQWWY